MLRVMRGVLAIIWLQLWIIRLKVPIFSSVQVGRSQAGGERSAHCFFTLVSSQFSLTKTFHEGARVLGDRCNATVVEILSYFSIDPVCKVVRLSNTTSLYTLLYIKPDKHIGLQGRYDVFICKLQVRCELRLSLSTIGLKAGLI